MKRYRVTATDSCHIGGVTRKEADPITSRPDHEPRPNVLVTDTATDLRRPLIAIALYAVGFVGLMLLVNPLHLAEGSEWLVRLPHLASQILNAVS